MSTKDNEKQNNYCCECKCECTCDGGCKGDSKKCTSKAAIEKGCNHHCNCWIQPMVESRTEEYPPIKTGIGE